MYTPQPELKNKFRRDETNSGCVSVGDGASMSIWCKTFDSDWRELFRARTSVAEACLRWQPDGESRRASPPVAASLTASSVAHTERERLRDSETAVHTER